MNKYESIINSFENKEWLAHLKNLTVPEILVITLLIGLSCFFLQDFDTRWVTFLGPTIIFFIIIIQVYGYFFYLGRAHVEEIKKKFNEVTDNEWPEMEKYFITQLRMSDFTGIEKAKKLILKLNIFSAYSTIAMIWSYDKNLGRLGIYFSIFCTLVYLILCVRTTRKHCVERAIEFSLKYKRDKKL